MTVFDDADAAVWGDPNLIASATYTPPGGGAAVPVTVILARAATEDRGFVTPGLRLSALAQAAALIAEVQRSQLAAPAKGGTLAILAPSPDAGSYTVAEPPELDDTRAAWRLALKQA